MRKSIIITGCSSGIGEETIKKLIELKEFKIYACYRNPDKSGSYYENSDQIKMVQLDLAETKSIDSASLAIIQEIEKNNEELYSIINIAGISYSGPIELIPINDIEKIFKVNVISYVCLIQHFIKYLRKSRGVIINTGSYSGKLALPFLAPYAMSKFALRAFTDSLRMELKPWNISVVILEPGSIKTAIWDKAIKYMNTLKETSDPDLAGNYADHFGKLYQATYDLKKNSIAPSKVAKVILKILKNKNNSRRKYIIGLDAHLMIFLAAILPGKIKDYVLMRFLKLQKIKTV